MTGTRVAGVIPADAERAASRFALLVAGGFAAAALSGLLQHEMWRDELQAWLVARDSATPLDLLRHLEYEGHPGLWHFSLWLLKHVAPVPAVMRALHWMIAVATVYLVARYAPFSRVQRALFALGYFPLFEYAAVSRNYALGAALTFGACALFFRREAHPLVLALVVGLLAYTNVFGFILGIAFAAAWATDLLAARSGSAPASPRRGTGWVVPALVVATFFASSALQLLPPSDSGYARKWYLDLERTRLLETALTLPSALFPFRQWNEHWWATTPLGAMPGWRLVLAPLAFAAALLAVLALRRRRAALVFLLFAGAGVLAFFYLKWRGGLNHSGHLFLALVAALWLGHRETGTAGAAAGQPLWRFVTGPGLTFLLAAHAIAGILAVGFESRYTFSMGRTAAAFLRDRRLDRHRMVADPDFAATTVLGYLGKGSAWYPRGGRQGSFVVWDLARRHPVSDSAIVAAADSISRAEGDTVVVLLNRTLGPEAATRLIPLVSLTGAVVPTENYHVYLLVPGRQE